MQLLYLVAKNSEGAANLAVAAFGHSDLPELAGQLTREFDKRTRVRGRRTREFSQLTRVWGQRTRGAAHLTRGGGVLRLCGW